LSQVESEHKKKAEERPSRSKHFFHIAVGLFFLASTTSLIILMYMLIKVWQPIWSEGFKDFHTISDAIGKLDETAKPASDTIPMMLNEMVQMNKNMYEMQVIMADMNESLMEIEKVTPNIQDMTASINEMNVSINQMNVVLDTRMTNMVYMMGSMDNKMPDMDFMPFW